VSPACRSDGWRASAFPRFDGCTFRRAGDPAADDENAELIVIDK
jgi:hypothetical protein